MSRLIDSRLTEATWKGIRATYTSVFPSYLCAFFEYLIDRFLYIKTGLPKLSEVKFFKRNANSTWHFRQPNGCYRLLSERSVRKMGGRTYPNGRLTSAGKENSSTQRLSNIHKDGVPLKTISCLLNVS